MPMSARGYLYTPLFKTTPRMRERSPGGSKVGWKSRVAVYIVPAE